jgi:hypothetical protein
VSGIFQSGHFITSGYSQWTTASAPRSTTQPPDFSRLHSDVHVTGPVNHVATFIWQGTAMLGTDGSILPACSTYSWILSTSLNAVSADAPHGGWLPPPAKYSDQSSKRPEAAAIYVPDYIGSTKFLHSFLTHNRLSHNILPCVSTLTIRLSSKTSCDRSTIRCPLIIS